MNRRITQGQATRSTLALDFVTHFMGHLRSVALCGRPTAGFGPRGAAGVLNIVYKTQTPVNRKGTRLVVAGCPCRPYARATRAAAATASTNPSANGLGAPGRDFRCGWKSVAT